MKLDIDLDKLDYMQIINLYEIIFNDQFPNFGMMAGLDTQKKIIKKCIESGTPYEPKTKEGDMV